MTPTEAPVGNDLPNLFPALNAATELALRESIRRFGVLVPVVRDQHGRTLDGHHRSRIADDEKLPYRVDVVKVDGDEQAREIAATLNADRRQMAPDQVREHVRILRAAGHSQGAIAQTTGVTQGRISQIEAELISANELAVPERAQGLDGKSRPAKPPLVAAKNAAEAERAQQAMDADLPGGRVLDVKRAERIKREQQAERQRAEPIEPVSIDGEVWIYHCDFRDIPQELDLIGAVVITDPPYPREFLPEWEAMAQIALDAGCDRLVAMCGQVNLPDAIAAIEQAARPAAYARWIAHMHTLCACRISEAA